ncbi:hypothetical protein ACFS7Z_18805 [Pontibacter toksunensis]|uniref:Secreted protein n=1 Tax=Pontibacter toksunensis TaxID=1332631 RepID=A0ABW6BX75_9BACT
MSLSFILCRFCCHWQVIARAPAADAKGEKTETSKTSVLEVHGKQGFLKFQFFVSYSLEATGEHITAADLS